MIIAHEETLAELTLCRRLRRPIDAYIIGGRCARTASGH